MPLTTQDWHQRFTQQASWTSSLRKYIYQRTQLLQAQRILEVGSGTGAIISALLSDLPSARTNKLHGLDINSDYLNFARNRIPDVTLTQGDAHRLPYSDNTFDATICHFLLLWVKYPDKVLNEMTRVTRSNGSVIAIAEPDYGGRIDYPDELAEIGHLQALSLNQQGADSNMGRKLAGLFSHAGLINIEFGVLGGQWEIMNNTTEDSYEWAVVLDDLNGLISKEKINRLQQLDNMAQSSGERVLFVPTFYAYGQVAQNN
jgi:SAM-dependent methyltransferase